MKHLETDQIVALIEQKLKFCRLIETYKVADIITNAYKSGNKIIISGNGASNGRY